jgi:hypothetical protein
VDPRGNEEVDMPDIKATVITPDIFVPVGNANPFPVGEYEQRYLVQGDSWFSIGALAPEFTTNVPSELTLSRSTLVVNCARPGKVLARMTDTVSDPKFLSLLSGRNTRWPWDALVMSGGGNDLIDASVVPGTVPPAQRLLLRSDEWGSQADASRYLSEAGWQTFCDHMKAVFDFVLARRAEAVHPDMPIVLHTYDFVTPRNAPAGAAMGPWLFKAMNDLYGIPPQDWNALSDLMITKLAALLRQLASSADNVHVVDGLGRLQRADPQAGGPSHHWENEIHPTQEGYQVLAQAWRPVLDAFPRLDPV